MQNEVLQFVSIPLYRKGLCSSDRRSDRNRKGRRECFRNDVWWTGERESFSHSIYPLPTIFLFFSNLPPSQGLRIALVLMNTLIGSPIPYNGHIAQRSLNRFRYFVILKLGKKPFRRVPVWLLCWYNYFQTNWNIIGSIFRERSCAETSSQQTGTRFIRRWRKWNAW